MIQIDLPYPQLVTTDPAATAVDIMLQQYQLVREERTFNLLANNSAGIKTVIITTQALDNIMHIGINYCNDITIEQTANTLKNINWDYPDFDKIEQDLLPVILMMLMLGIMKIPVNSQQLINWKGYVNKYSHVLPNK